MEITSLTIILSCFEAFMYCASAVMNVVIAILRPEELHSGKYPSTVLVFCYILRQLDFNLYALN